MTIIRRIPQPYIAQLAKGGSKDFGFCKITMVHSDFPSVFPGPGGVLMPGGSATGFIIEIPCHNMSFYHPGDTNLFSDMKLIDDLYKPDLIFLPIGNVITIGPREAAYACANFFKRAKYVVPMLYSTAP
jgi:L-ascorbate metabolism protein UlaG (beta-lactamase superfamily)